MLSDLMIAAIVFVAASIAVLSLSKWRREWGKPWAWLQPARALVGIYWLVFYLLLFLGFDLDSRLLIRSPILLTLAIMLAAIIMGRKR